ncbi:MAG: hypothetical protein SFW36_23195 [Leptolyngbyaceae cyanobacterium bins.59]|nr:hypothetical protein [Leptolyngbyaceae cyanobacterium bins.59]
MATATRSSSRSKLVHKTALEQAQMVLKELPKREKEHLSLAEAMTGMSGIIRDSISKGYSYDELAELLSAKLGVSVSAWSLKRYVPSESKRGRGKQASPEVDGEPKKRGRKRAGQPTAGSDTEPVSVAQLLEFPAKAAITEPAPVVEVSSNGSAAPEPDEAPKRAPRSSRTKTTTSRTASKAKTSRSPRAAATGDKPKRGRKANQAE